MCVLYESTQNIDKFLNELKEATEARVKTYMSTNGKIKNWNVQNVQGVCMFFNGPGSLSPIEEILIDFNYPIFKQIYTPNRLLFECSQKVKLCAESPIQCIQKIDQANCQLKSTITNTNILPPALLHIVYSFIHNDERVFCTINADAEFKDEWIFGIKNLFTIMITWASDKWYQNAKRLDYYRLCSTLCMLKIAEKWKGHNHEDAFLKFTQIDRVILDQVSLLKWEKNEIRFLCAEKCKETQVWKPFLFRVNFFTLTRTYTIIQ